jgi:hypothetical protein
MRAVRIARLVTVLVAASAWPSAPAVAPASAIVAGPRPVRMVATPGYVLRVCRRSALLAHACPGLLPAVSHLSSEHPYTASLCRAGARGCLGLRWDDLELQHAGPGNRPPRWAHVSVLAGRLDHAFSFAYPAAGPAVTPRDGLFAPARRRPLFLGRRRWGRASGTLVLAPSYPSGGEQGDHLIFRSRHGGVEFAVTLHAWEPLLQAVATLRAMVRSIPD